MSIEYNILILSLCLAVSQYSGHQHKRIMGKNAENNSSAIDDELSPQSPTANGPTSPKRNDVELNVKNDIAKSGKLLHGILSILY